MNPIGVITGIGSVLNAVRGVRDSVAQFRKTGGFSSELDAAVARLIADRDQDKDGALSRAEFGGDAKAFARLDTNGDGKLDSQELRATFK